MSLQQVRCPTCQCVLQVPGAAAGGTVLKCPKCAAKFRVPAPCPPAVSNKAMAPPAPASPLQPRTAPARPGARPAPRVPAKAMPAQAITKKTPGKAREKMSASTPAQRDRTLPKKRRNAVLAWGVIVGSLLLLGGGIILAVANRPEPKEEQLARADHTKQQPKIERDKARSRKDTRESSSPAEKPVPKPEATPEKPAPSEKPGPTNDDGANRLVDPMPVPAKKPASRNEEVEDKPPQSEPDEKPKPDGKQTGSVPKEEPLPSREVADPKEPEQPQGETQAGKQPPLLVLDPLGHTSTVRKVLFTPDGRKVISVAYDKTVRVWDVGTGEVDNVFRLPMGPGNEGILNGAALAPDGQTLAVAGVPFGNGRHGMLIYLIRLSTGRVEKTFKGHTSVVMAVDFSRDGTLLASASSDRTVRLYDVTTGKTVRIFQGHNDSIRDVAFGPSGALVATVCMDGTAAIWSVATGKMVASLKDGARIIAAAWSPDGQTLATGSGKESITLWSAAGARKETYPLGGNKDTEITSLAFTRDGRELLYTGIAASGVAGIFSRDSGKVRLRFDKHSNTVMHGSLSRDGKRAVTTGGDNHETFVWSTEDGSVVQKLQGGGQSVYGVGWAKDGKSIAWGNTNQGDTRSARSPLEHSFRLEDLELMPAAGTDFGRIATRNSGFSLQAVDFFRVAIKYEDRPLHTFVSPQKGDRIYSFTMIPGGRAVIGGSFGLYLVDCRTNKLLKWFIGHSGLVLGVCPSPDGRYFVTGSSDQTVRIWDPARDQPLLSLFIAGRDWIAWTPEGYYAASPYGERLMGWQINNGPGVMASYYPAVQFRLSLYRPDVIKLVLAAGSVEKALALANKGNGNAAAPLTVSEVLPPSVKITAPTRAGRRTGKATMEIKASAKSVGKHPVTALRLLVDGRPYGGAKGIRTIDKPRLGAVEASWTVALMPGKQAVAVQAESAVSKALSRPLEITYTGGNKADLPNLYLLAVGVSLYEGEMRLHYAATDAVAIALALKRHSAGVFKKVEIRLIVDKAATGRAIVEGLAWLQSKMTQRDVGIVFFSGHGMRDPKGRFYLVPVDVNPDDPGGTCVSGDLLKKALGNMPGRLVAIFDACHSGAVAQDKKPAVADDLVRDLVTDDYGVVTMCSSLGREYSLESSEVAGGFYTLSLVEGLSGKADFNRDRFIFIHELEVYSLLRVRQLSRGQQNPVTGKPPAIRSFPLGKR